MLCNVSMLARNTTMTTPAAKPPLSTAQRIGQRMVRLLLIGAVLYAGWTIVASWSLLLGEAKPAAEVSGLPPELTTSMPAELLAALPPGRSWVLAAPLKPQDKTPAPMVPLPEAVQRVCLQADGQGNVFAEIVSSPLPAADLAAHWQREGWQVSWGRTAEDGSRSLVLRSGGAAIRVWIGPLDAESKRHVVFLVRGENK